MEALYPLHLCGVAKTPIWGGTRLLREWNKSSDADTMGESWELTVRKKENCKIVNGPLSGKELREVIDTFGAELTGASFGSSDFPLLIKFLDAGDTLSVQVHPDDDYAARVENDRGKTEMWYIVEADEGAELIFGLAEGFDTEDFVRAVKAGDPESALHHQPVQAGESYFIPSGMAHAIGRGILIAEIQQNCDLTYRVYDFDRRQPDGSLRELHVEKAVDVIRPFAQKEIDAIRYSRTGGVAEHENVLVDCPYFRVEKLDLRDGTVLLPQEGKMRHLLCIGGEGDLHADGKAYRVSKGESWLLPACVKKVTASGELLLLLSTVAD